mmetsp:Transcript_49432/g.119915  ORF Transcript_49432/g.119915 Transcript_49432/m.119915 type:complete len:911 (+) Transcript_49432:90-2822(+)
MAVPSAVKRRGEQQKKTRRMKRRQRSATGDASGNNSDDVCSTKIRFWYSDSAQQQQQEEEEEEQEQEQQQQQQQSNELVLMGPPDPLISTSLPSLASTRRDSRRWTRTRRPWNRPRAATPTGRVVPAAAAATPSPALVGIMTITTPTRRRRRADGLRTISPMSMMPFTLSATLLHCVLLFSLLFCCSYVDSAPTTETTSTTSTSTSTTSSKATISIIGSNVWTYRALLVDPSPTSSFSPTYASFYSSILESSIQSQTSSQNNKPINLMTPPLNYSTLCEFPTHLLSQLQGMVVNNDTTSIEEEQQEQPEGDGQDEESNLVTFGTSGPVALLVSLGGGCDVVQKATIAYQLQQFVSNDIQVLVLYHNDGSNPNVIPSINFRLDNSVDDGSDGDHHLDDGTENIISDNDTTTNATTVIDADPEQGQDEQQVQLQLQRIPSLSKILESFVFLSVSTGTGNAILSTMERLAAGVVDDEDSIRPELLGPNNVQEWRLDMTIQRLNETETNSGDTETEIVGGEGSSFGESDLGDNDDEEGRYPHSPSSSDDDNEYGDSFYWLRFVLFTLLILAPCIRAGFLWWAGGGRIHFRRDEETGRIIGLMYIPPMIHWFGQHDDDDFDPASTCLSEDDVFALPEILYEKPDEEIVVKPPTTPPASKDSDEKGIGRQDGVQEEDGGNDESASEYDQDRNNLEMNGMDDDDPSQIAIRYGRTDSDDGDGIIDSVTTSIGTTNDKNDTTPDEATKVSCPTRTDQPLANDSRMDGLKETDQGDNRVDEERAVDHSPSSDDDDDGDRITGRAGEVQRTESVPVQRHFTTTTCTTCSICIEEFDVGEKLRLLPRCGHSFHTECILPWLTERQGCCPLCKTMVDPDHHHHRNPDHSTDEEATADNDFDDADDVDNNHTAVDGERDVHQT